MEISFLYSLGSSDDIRRAELSKAFLLLHRLDQSDPNNIEAGEAAAIVRAYDYLTLCIEVFIIELQRNSNANRVEILRDLKGAIEMLKINKSTRDEQGLFWKKISTLRAKALAASPRPT